MGGAINFRLSTIIVISAMVPSLTRGGLGWGGLVVNRKLQLLLWLFDSDRPT